MRLICPNCGAQYEVPDEVIPTDGRDVQCSNCGHTWFQMHPDDDEDLAEELGTAPVAPKGGPAPAPDLDEYDEDEEYDEPQAVGSQDPVPAAQVPPAGPSRPARVDPAIASILQQEARHEATLRASERQTLESQPDLGLDAGGESDRDFGDRDAETRSREARARVARMRGEDDTTPETVSEEAIAAAVANSRRELLPDIDEINSTLRSADEPREAPPSPEPEPAPAQGGFRRGFSLILLLFAILLMLYVFAPALGGAVPALEPVLSAYVDTVNTLRTMIDSAINGTPVPLE